MWEGARVFFLFMKYLKEIMLLQNYHPKEVVKFEVNLSSSFLFGQISRCGYKFRNPFGSKTLARS